jgi:hypothetical protein
MLVRCFAAGTVTFIADYPNQSIAHCAELESE